MVDTAAAASQLVMVGFNLRRMNREGLNHVTYYEPQKKKGRASAEWNGRWGWHIMDKGSNEAERKREWVRERKEGCSGVEKQKVGK